MIVISRGLPLVVSLLSIGCGGPQYGEVEGVVTRNGEPLPDLEVFFLPDPSLGTKGPEASGLTDARGRYRLHTHKADRDGVLVGKHYVCLRDCRLGPYDPPKMGRVPDYDSPANTPLQNVEVKPGQQTIDLPLTSLPQAPSR